MTKKNKARLGAIVSVLNTATAPSLTELTADPPALETQTANQVVTISVNVEDPDGNLQSVTLDQLRKPGKLESLVALGTLSDDGTAGERVHL